MSRNLKTLGLVLASLLALSAVVASSASAGFTFGASGAIKNTIASNTIQSFKYSTFSLTVNCTTVGGEGSATGPETSELHYTPVYSGCTTSLGQTVDINMNGCYYLLTTPFGGSASVHIVCPGANKIQVTVTEPVGTSICTLTKGSQTPGGTTTLTNEGSGTTMDLLIHTSLTGIVSTRHGSSICGPENSTTGTTTGTITTTSEIGSTHVSLTVS